MAKAKGKKKTEVLDYGAQVRSLREQGPGRLYLLWGREDYLREQYLLELKKLCLPGGEDDFSYHRFDGAELDFQALADAVDAVPFLTERTLIEVRGFDTNKCREEEAQALVRVIGDLPDYCTLVFLMSTDFEPDGRLKTTKAFKKYGELIQFTAQGESAQKQHQIVAERHAAGAVFLVIQQGIQHKRLNTAFFQHIVFCFLCRRIEVKP